MRSGAASWLDGLDGIPERDVLARYPYALAAYADLHASLGTFDEALAYLDRALVMTQSSPAQQEALTRKRAALGDRGRSIVLAERFRHAGQPPG
jgi:predicted RNA polymerase sigma factor